jgi:hypothetical protein
MFKLKTLVLDIANFANNLVTLAKIQQIGAYKTLANITGSTANISEVNIGYTPNGAVTLSGNVTYAKSDFAGKTHLLLSTNNTSTRTFTVSNTGFVNGDFICLLIDQNSSGDVSVTIGTRAISNNRGNIINGLFDGTNWHVWSGGGVFNTSSGSFSKTTFGLLSSTAGVDATAFGHFAVASANYATVFGKSASGSGASATAFGRNATASGASNPCTFGDTSTASANSTSAFGNNSSASASSSSAFGRNASANSSDAMALGAFSSTNSFSWLVALGNFLTGRRYGAFAYKYDTTTSAGTNPSLNGEKIAFSGTTTNATITEIFLRGVSSNRCVLQAKNVLSFRGQAVAYRSDYTGSARWSIEGLIKRDGSNNTTLVGVTATLTHSDGTGNTLVLTITADDTNEALKVEVTGNASETWTWGVELELLDLRIA